MAEPINFRSVKKRFETPQSPLPEPVSGGTAVALNPEELAEMAYEAMQREMSPQTAGLLPSRGPVDDPARLLQQPTGPAYDPAADSPILELMQPGTPAMERPPSLHTPEELAAGLEGPGGPPTISRTPEPRGEAAGPAVGQGNSALQMLAKIAGFALPALDAAARGVSAGERSGSFLGGFGAASQAEEQRQMRNRDFETGQRQRAAQTDAVEQRTEMLPQQLEMERRNQEILTFRAEQQARYMETLTQQIAQQMKLKPQELRRDQLNAIARVAQQEGQRRTEERLMEMRLAKSPEEAEMLLAQIDAEKAQAEYYRAQAARQYAEAGEAGRPDPVKPAPAPSATALASLARNIMAIRKDLRDRYSVQSGSGVVEDKEAMRNDPDYPQLQELEEIYQEALRTYKGEPETGSGSAPTTGGIPGVGRGGPSRTSYQMPTADD
jgi:hypothetical protein